MVPIVLQAVNSHDFPSLAELIYLRDHPLIMFLPGMLHRPLLLEYFTGQDYVVGLVENILGDFVCVVEEVDHFGVVKVAQYSCDAHYADYVEVDVGPGADCAGYVLDFGLFSESFAFDT